MRVVVRIVTFCLATVVVADRHPVDAQPVAKPVGEAVAVGDDAAKMSLLEAEAKRLRPEVGKRLEALSSCIDRASGRTAKLACVDGIRKVVRDYFDAEIAIRQMWIHRDERDLRDLDRRIADLQARGAQERAAEARRVSVNLVDSYAAVREELRARIARELQAVEPDRRYIRSLEETIREYDRTLSQLRLVQEKSEEPAIWLERSIANLLQFRTYAEARLSYARAHHYTYVVEQSIVQSTLGWRESDIMHDAIGGEDIPAPPVPDTTQLQHLSRPGRSPKPPAATASPRYASLVACLEAKRMTAEQCESQLKKER